jgi:signal transduction histidine kinase
MNFKGFAQQPGDTDEVAFSKRLVLVVAMTCCICGMLWGLLYGAVFGVGVVMALALAFVAIVGGAIVVSARLADHRPLIYAQIVCIMWVPALIQWCIGSAFDSGLVICWSFLGPVGALMFLSVRKAIPWMAMFIGIVAISALLEPALLGAPLPVSPRTRALFLVMNMGVSSAVVFAAAAAFVRNLQTALTDLKEAQVQIIDTEKQAVIGRLASGILHEMNTPLGAIRSSSDTLGKALERLRKFVAEHASGDSAEAQQALRMAAKAPKVHELIDTSVDRLSAVVGGLARFVSLDESERKAIDVRESLDTGLALLADSLANRVQVERDYDEDVPDVMCFPAKLNQVFLSVLQNAAQAIGERGTIRLGVSVDGEALAVVVADTGRGIPASQLAGLFDIGLTKKEGRVGMQLGLPMSKRHLDEIGGSIALDSIEGEGTTVRIVVPISAT